MQAIPPALQTRFEDHLRSKAIPDPLLWSYIGLGGDVAPLSPLLQEIGKYPFPFVKFSFPLF
jgi:hypothetical protein